MTPQFVDLDGDNRKDLVMGTYTGFAWWVPGNEDGLAQPQRIKDRNGDNVVVSTYWDDDSSNFENADRSPTGESHPNEHGTSAAAVDWDADGDKDLLLGSYEGHLYLRENLGKPGNPKFAAANRRVLAGGKPLTIKGGITAPRIIDWNGDKMFDIVCGGVEGGVFVFENQGTRTSPEFASPQTLIKPIGNRQTSTDGMVLAPSKNGKPLCPVSSLHVEVVDYDQDGDLDLLVGGESTWFSKPPKALTIEGKKRLEKLDRQASKLQNKMEQIMPEEMLTGDSKSLEALEKSEELQELNTKMMSIYEELDRLEPYPDKTKNYVWLYRQK